MKILLKVLHIIFNIVLTTALVVSVLLLVLTAKSPFKMFSLYKVMSGSMEPTIMTGSIVISQIVDPAKLVKDDVITYTAINDASTTVTHRLVDIQSKNSTTVFITKGDANNIPDPDKIDPMRVKGKAIIAIPFLGFVLNWLKTPLGFIIAIVIPALFIIIREVLIIKKLIEQSAIEKFKKQNPPLLHMILIFFLSIALTSISAQRTVSYFSSGLVLSGNIFATGQWTSDPTALLIISADGHSAKFTVTNTSPYDLLSYTLTYDTDTQSQGIVGKIPINGENSITKDGLMLGTSSTGGAFTYDTGIKNMTLTITLTNSYGDTKNLTAHP